MSGLDDPLPDAGELAELGRLNTSERVRSSACESAIASAAARPRVAVVEDELPLRDELPRDLFRLVEPVWLVQDMAAQQHRRRIVRVRRRQTLGGPFRERVVALIVADPRPGDVSIAELLERLSPMGSAAGPSLQSRDRAVALVTLVPRRQRGGAGVG